MFQMSGDGAKNTHKSGLPVVEKPPNDYYCESIGAIGCIPSYSLSLSLFFFFFSALT